jgi:hypothetical protein
MIQAAAETGNCLLPNRYSFMIPSTFRSKKPTLHKNKKRLTDGSLEQENKEGNRYGCPLRVQLYR